MAKRERKPDPMEAIIADGLDREGFRYERERIGLDFYLIDYDLFIEAKQFHTDRVAGQMARATNVIAVQGLEAAEFLAALLCDFKKTA